MGGLLGLAVLGGIAALALFAHRRGQAPTWAPPSLPLAGQSVEDLVAAGRKIEAVKRYRELHGVGLKDAKDAVEALAAGLPGA